MHLRWPKTGDYLEGFSMAAKLALSFDNDTNLELNIRLNIYDDKNSICSLLTFPFSRISRWFNARSVERNTRAKCVLRSIYGNIPSTGLSSWYVLLMLYNLFSCSKDRLILLNIVFEIEVKLKFSLNSLNYNRTF